MPSDHSAAPSVIGYIYQSQWALLELLRESGDRPDAALSVELFDDVAWDVSGTPTELLQVKHHLEGRRNLTDLSEDLLEDASSLDRCPQSG